VVHNLICEDFARGHIITVAEATWQDEYMVLVEAGFVVDETVYVDAVSLCAGQFKGVLGFDITIYSCRPQDDGFNFFHVCCSQSRL
jgi:hypothetical protein